MFQSLRARPPALRSVAREAGVDLVILARYMQILTQGFLDRVGVPERREAVRRSRPLAPEAGLAVVVAGALGGLFPDFESICCPLKPAK